MDSINLASDFRTEVTKWISSNFPATLRTEEAQDLYYRTYPRYPDREDFIKWKRLMAAKGWNGPAFPREFGGGGLTVPEAQFVEDELTRFEAFKPARGSGLTLLAPVLLEVGSEYLKRRFLPEILRGDMVFCQGFSEPGAGSDLASLSTTAEDLGDHFVVTGAKIWTSGAMFADWCFCLVRTSKLEKHGGISLLLIDLRSEGIARRPIQLITEQSIFAELRFENVAVPKENLVGQLNDGWKLVGKILNNERSGGRHHRRHLASDQRPLRQIAEAYGLIGADGECRNIDLEARMTRCELDQEAVSIAEVLLMEENAMGLEPSIHPSALKNIKSSILQQREELIVELMGQQGIGWSGEAFSKNELDTTRAMLSNKAVSIFAGTHEIQNNIISARVLGLPK